jgi:hypothetical protein
VQALSLPPPPGRDAAPSPGGAAGRGLVLVPGKADPTTGGHEPIPVLVARALARLRRWWGYRPERRYMRGPGRAAR